MFKEIKSTNFTATSNHDIIRIVNFLDFIYQCNKSYKFKNTNMLATKINFTGSSTRVMDLKFLPEPRDRLNMLQKNYQRLFLPDQLFMN